MADKDVKPACKYGADCYQRNQAHKDRFDHPSTDQPREERRRSSSPLPVAKRRKSSTPSDNESDSNTGDNVEDDNDGNGNGNGNGKLCQNSNTEVKDMLTEKETETIESNESAKSVVASEIVVECPKTSASVGARCSEFIKESFDKGPHAQRAEHQNLLESPLDFIAAKFLVTMPSDFLAFWEFCESQTKNNSTPEKLFSKFGLSLVGPFDVLAKKFHDIEPFEPGDYLRHWRFYYDPPEFQTVMVIEKTGIHYGYWRDEPNGDCLIARNDAAKNCEFTFIAENLFGAILYFLEKDAQLSLFNKPAATALKKSIQDFSHRNNISLSTFPAKLKSRNLKTVCKTFHRAGLAVPYNRKTDVGYRQLGESDANLKKTLSQFTEANGDKDLITAAMDKLQPLITAANIACDESDFGNTIELGTDLFCFGAPELHSDALQLLATGYKMVKKPQFIAIIKAHLEHRIKDHTKLSILDKVQRSN